MKQIKIVLFGLLIIPMLVLAGVFLTSDQNAPLETQVLSQPAPVMEDWGQLYLYTTELTNTYGIENVSSGIVEIKSGYENHPPHQHAEEEFLILLEGSGTWSINGEKSAAHAGDLMYARPWDRHGLKNTGDVPLKFYFIKWNGKGVDPAKKSE